jgi:hypothetical protein|tara:strand:- start:86 stop:247 length:162 start_codon:yes stop_codon:yes gene_type:complete
MGYTYDMAYSRLLYTSVCIPILDARYKERLMLFWFLVLVFVAVAIGAIVARFE